MTTLTPHPYTTADATPRAPRRFHTAITTRNLRQWIALRALASSFLSLHPATEKLRRFRPMPACLSAASGPTGVGR
ncbi:MAG: hypothetical protein ACLP8S_14335 [Solirubrobacteraceae bacterium]|jgi:hypothetical protein